MDTMRAALEPAHDDGALRQVDVIPAQITSLRDPQAMAVDDQPDQPIPVTVSIAFEGGQQLVHFGLGQMLPDPVGMVPLPSLCATGRITILFSPPKLDDFARHFYASGDQLIA